MNGSGPRLTVGYCLFVSLLLLILPLPWIVAVAVAASVHELFHILMIRFLGGDLPAIALSATGAKITMSNMSQGRELLCALAGPVGSLSLLLLSKWFPRIALCGGIQAVFNLLPIYPLDGGRALRCGLALICKPSVGFLLYSIISTICRIFILVLAIYGCFWLHLGIFPLFLASGLLLRTK